MTNHFRKLDYVSPSELKPHNQNPRKHSPAQINALERSIKAFGFNAPILVDKDMQVVCGHGRLLAANHAGLEKIPIICLDDLNEAQIKAYRLADNKLSDLSEFDDALVAVHLKELAELSLDFELEATGFEAPEIDIRIQSLGEQVADPCDDFEMPTGPAVSQVGDLWVIGDHILNCGDATASSTYARFPSEIQAAAVFADAPYNLEINGHVSGRGKAKHREFVQGSGELSDEDYCRFLCDAIRQATERTVLGGLQYWCMDWRGSHQLHRAATTNLLEQINLCVWVKSNGGMGSLYRSRHELIYVYKWGNAAHRNNVQLGKFGRNRSNVWHYAGATVPSGRKALQYHPTPKPIALVADAFLDCTVRGDYVLDPFMGSGTTLLAAEKIGRKALGIELDPLYVDTAIMRWQKMTGGIARLQSGKSFEEVKAERADND